MNDNIMLRPMTLSDYPDVKKLWLSIHGFGIRSVDDSYDGVKMFLERNEKTSVVAVLKDTKEIIGSILCGHDGRRATFYHVCVREDYRRMGIGKEMVTFCMMELKKLKINKISLVAFKDNEIGNSFWNGEGWTVRTDINQYEFVLNEENITRFNK